MHLIISATLLTQFVYHPRRLMLGASKAHVVSDRETTCVDY